MEKTFKAYTPGQAQAYAQQRGAYNERLYNIICDYHAETGGLFGTLVDLGCGPGNSTRPLAKRFEKAYGIDPSEGMIETARSISLSSGQDETKSGEYIYFSVGRAEDVGEGVRGTGEKVDMITAGMAAHWFDMPRFWQSASEVLRKGGTVALWARPSLYCHPSFPNASVIQKILDRLEQEYLAPYEAPGNRLCRDYYDHLCLPWDVIPPVEGFSKDRFRRLEWDRGGQITSADGHFFLGDETVTLEQLGRTLSTASMVTRWREANLEVAGTAQDVVLRAIEDVRGVLGGEEIVVGGKSCILLLLKKG